MKAIVAALLLVSLTALAQTAEERLFEAIDDGKPLVAEGIVVRGKVNLNARNVVGEAPLHRAIERGFRELTALLVKSGAAVNVRSKNGETPLHLAALYEDNFYVELLLGAKADVKVKNAAGETALFWAVLTGNGGPARRLVEAGADVKATDLKGNTLLHAAADGAHVELSSAFLSLGVDPRQRNKNGKRPYDIAKERGYTDLMKLLERFERE